MAEYIFTLNNVNFKIRDLGTNLNSETEKFYAHFLTNQPLDYNHFNSVVIEQINSDNRYQAHDYYFTNLITSWRILIESGRPLNARRVWETALSPDLEWEKDNSSQFIHKGNPYYFCP